MATDLGLLQKLSQFQPSNCNHQISTQSHLSNHNSGGPPWMWNPSHQAQSQKQHQDQDDESWEVRAFAEDTGNIMGTTWPPRSYTCTFCRREFRSAQALGGHMNVHRRDRARLHQTAPSSSALIIPTQELMAAAAAASGGGGGLCLLYQLPNNHNGSIYTGAQTNANACNNLDSRVTSPSTLLSISPYPSNNHLLSPAGAAPQGLNHHHHHHLQYYNKLSEPTSLSADYSNCNKESSSSADNMEELDLELRL